MTSRRAVMLLSVLILLVQTACADAAITYASRNFSKWFVDQFGAIPAIILAVVLLIIAIVWGIRIRRRRSQNKQQTM